MEDIRWKHQQQRPYGRKELERPTCYMMEQRFQPRSEFFRRSYPFEKNTEPTYFNERCRENTVRCENAWNATHYNYSRNYSRDYDGNTRGGLSWRSGNVFVGRRGYSHETSKVIPQSSTGSIESSDDFPLQRVYRPRFHQSRRCSPIYPLRTFNNWAKVKIIQQAVPDTLTETLSVIDLGCYKGVDLKKWAHAKVHHVYLVDDNTDDMRDCLKRFLEIKERWPDIFKATFIEKDFIYEKIIWPEQVDVVSCQFFVQKAFTTNLEAHNFAKNIFNALKVGGHLLVSIVNADKIKELLLKSQDKKTCGNDVFSVELQYPITEATSEFGIKMIFRVADKFFEENLVQMKTLEEVMKSHNLELVWRKSFPELYEEAVKSEVQRRLLTIMGVTSNGKLLMSPTQIETAALYEAAMFKKIDPTISEDEAQFSDIEEDDIADIVDHIDDNITAIRRSVENSENNIRDDKYQSLNTEQIQVKTSMETEDGN